MDRATRPPRDRLRAQRVRSKLGREQLLHLRGGGLQSPDLGIGVARLDVAHGARHGKPHAVEHFLRIDDRHAIGAARAGAGDHQPDVRS